MCACCRPPMRRLPHRLRIAVAIVLAALFVAGTTAGCAGGHLPGTDGSGPAGRDARGGDGRTGAPSHQPAPVTAVQARRILDHYERVATRADRNRDAALLAHVAAGNALERATAGYEQYDALPRTERAAFARPTSFRKPEFHIPAGARWFMVTATRTSPQPQHTVLVFARNGKAERPEATGGEAADGAAVAAWRLHAALPLQAGRLPRIATGRSGLAAEAGISTRSGTLRPHDVPETYEDLWRTGGTGEAAALAPNAVTEEARSTYRHRNDELGPERARRRFVPARPSHSESYALRTAGGGVLAVVPLAHEQRLRVTGPGYQITPSDEEAVYDATPRDSVVSTFHGQALAHLPQQGRPAVLSAKYALVDSR
ncbi:hypothetical protein SAMN05421870_110152 [Streptomyces qinglanensis]|uniref:DUF8094 domain-containing protein n=2 Tax=Streptomyces qinglanensis TaxID=943816 RepID=A0A1H9V636_9ACTN|nr:hypothetical protein SAMN05421870_110152 [Streptomyces qinglanensis]